MSFLRNALNVSVVMFGAASLPAYAASQTAKEDYVREPMPPGFQVIVSELDGPVFSDPQGHTVYKWQVKDLRVGPAGEQPGKPTCDNHVYRENAGLMSPYPPGLEMPEVDTRPSCVQQWPPVQASADAKPVGNWTIIDRPDGTKQWAYDGWQLYTFVLDKRPGDVLGGSLMDPTDDKGGSGALRRPMTPKSNIPPQFEIHTTYVGRSVELLNEHSVYASDRDSRNKSNCTEACLNDWEPVLAGEYARPVGEWTTFERSPGIRQWSFRGQPLYRRIADQGAHGQDGGELPGWHNVYAQKAPEPPKGFFTLKDTAIGTILGDARGMSVYIYKCTDDAEDQLFCDHPSQPQAYRMAICGGGDADRCLKTFPYVLAPVGTKSGNMLWGTMLIDPKTGKEAKAGTAGALNVWTFRDRPVYTFAGRKGYGDFTPFDVNADNWGETFSRNTFRSVVYRPAFMRGE